VQDQSDPGMAEVIIIADEDGYADSIDEFLECFSGTVYLKAQGIEKTFVYNQKRFMIYRVEMVIPQNRYDSLGRFRGTEYQGPVEHYIVFEDPDYVGL
jgi:hypothetical protein